MLILGSDPDIPRGPLKPGDTIGAMSLAVGARLCSVSRDEVVVVVVLVAQGTEVARWPVSGGAVDLEVIDRLARLALAARRAGVVLELREPICELRALIALAGLDEELPVREDE